MSLYTDRGAHYFHPRKLAAGSIGVIRPRSAGRSSNSASSISGPIRRIARRETGVLPGARCCEAVRSARSGRCRIVSARNSRLPRITDIEAANAFIRKVYFASARSICPPTMPASLLCRPARAWPSPPVPAVCARISSRRGSRSVSTPVHVYPDGTPSFTGRAASAATTSGTIRDVKSAA
jgi:hypothetical protein